MIFQAQESSGGGLHYTKVKAEYGTDKYGHRGYPNFVYQTTDGQWKRVDGSSALEETECVDGSVLITGTYHTSNLNADDIFAATQTLEGNTLVVSTKVVTVSISGGGGGTVVT